MEYHREDRNQRFLEQVYVFFDYLFKEVLEKRCQPESRFYLTGLPVRDEELLEALSEEREEAKASKELQRRWQELRKVWDREIPGQDWPRLLQLFYMYHLNEVWCLAVLLSYVYQSDPKYEKAVSILTGDSGYRNLPIFLVRALAQYLGMESSEERTQLGSESRKRMELFEKLPGGELKLQEYVILWLNKQEGQKITNQGIFQLYFGEENSCNIYQEALEWCSAVAKRQIQESLEEQVIFEIQGRRGAGKTSFCKKIAAKCGYRLCVLHLAAFLERPRQQRNDLIHEIFFTCRVNGCLMYLDVSGCREEETDTILWVKEIAAEYILLFVGAELNSTICQKASLFTQKFAFHKLSLEDSFTMWKWMESQYPLEKEIAYEQLAGKYRLLPGGICEVLARAERYRQQKKVPTIDFELLMSCIRENNQFLGNPLMERIDTVFTWKDLRVEQAVIAGMQLACAHIKYRFSMEKVMGKQTPYGKGVGVLMYGPPGTGKTMAAQVIANELHMDLCRVDLSQVTSKYIGETEKNLEKIFREAENSNVILFFDEADSMFGKRTEVKDSNDKYANQETSYILQRIESYEGMVILATNFTKNFDSAFMRRITISIRFSLPDEATRKLLWQDMLENTPLGKEESLLENLAAQFELSGSNIKNIVRNAGFLALMEQRNMEIGDIAKAIRIEFEKIGNIPNVSTFGMFYGYL